jgi:cell division protein FtsW
MKELINKHIKGDRVIWIVVLFLSLLSLLIVYSSTSLLSYKRLHGNTEALILRHTFFLIAGFGVMIFVHKQKLNVISKLSQLAVIGSAGLLLLTMTLGWGGNASRWLFGFQPSDIAKISLIVYLARQLSQNKEELKDFKLLVKKIITPIAVICALILPADLSTALMLFTVCVTMIFVANISLKHIGSVMGIAIIGFGFILILGLAFPKLLPRVGTWNSRIEAFWKGDKAEDAVNKNHQSNQHIQFFNA